MECLYTHQVPKSICLLYFVWDTAWGYKKYHVHVYYCQSHCNHKFQYWILTRIQTIQGFDHLIVINLALASTFQPIGLTFTSSQKKNLFLSQDKTRSLSILSIQYSGVDNSRCWSRTTISSVRVPLVLHFQFFLLILSFNVVFFLIIFY